MLILLVSIASRTSGQEYLTLPVDDKARNDRNVALQCLKNPAVFAAKKRSSKTTFKITTSQQ